VQTRVFAGVEKLLRETLDHRPLCAFIGSVKLATWSSPAIALPLDVTNAERIEYAVRRAERVFGDIDVLIHNAGYGYLAAVEKGEDKDIHAVGVHPSWSDGHFINGAILDCADDAAAIESAKKYADGHDIEVWDRKRKVAAVSGKLK
jgi:NAD(P)-dependent dehydrogenase (short-subunit alcohol dehydrogenase family)